MQSEETRAVKVPKFKRCKIGRPQLIVLMHHFGAFHALACGQAAVAAQAQRPPHKSGWYTG